ncbi:MAG: phospholipid methyltransferase [Chelatococcus sp.]|nr:phospholipid methyltransferase [Chelatococcus sp. HY11]MBX3546220.1 phospholipid methyltransferase [Chelatococcus sp.]CAH1661715.1 Phosphatidylethanolamine/phosphatidyl-N-methylethanolamine N-methyltransferase [Hyphomicrobiales bacterium]CAH1683010.1 Phosphatidylethanolamine/phosphatidyl-N-methylethanolamine N-methyltransferase [Hyphomicrobiales bacterium]
MFKCSNGIGAASEDGNHVFQHSLRNGSRPVRIEDEARFLKSWVENPLRTGAVSPSGRHLARTMASYVDCDVPGPVIELGPGTGPVTEAILKHGLPEERLVLVEFNPDFCKLLRLRFPKATVVQGDAYNLGQTLQSVASEPAAAVVSGLPLFTKPLSMRRALLDQTFALMHRGAPFIQFTYATVPPIPRRGAGYSARGSARIWWNLPPARVWVYRRDIEAKP